jgi:hypothetical protein
LRAPQATYEKVGVNKKARCGEIWPTSILLSGIKLAFVQSGLCNAHELRKMLGIANKQNEQRLAIIDSPLQT